MFAVRGATTVPVDTEEEIKRASAELFDAVIKTNNIDCGQIISVVISMTKDIKSYYPARAIRENGYDNIPLFSCAEPDIDGALKLCIRYLITVDSGKNKKDIKHIYLNKAAGLRPDLARSQYNLPEDK